jgi:WD40 repeat protein
LWDLAGAPPVPRLGEPLPDQDDGVQMSAQSRDGNVVATASGDTVVVWDMTDRLHPRPRGSPLSGAGAVLSRDGRTLVTAGKDDNSCSIWDLTDPGQPPRLLGTVPTSGPALAISTDATMLATGADDGAAVLWNIRDRERPQRVASMNGGIVLVTALAFAPDGTRLAVGSGDLDGKLSINVWDLTDPGQPHAASLPTESQTGLFVDDFAFSPDGRTLAVADVSNTVLLRDLSEPARPQHLGQPLVDKQARSVAFAPDGNTLATSSADGLVVLWDTTDRGRIRRLGTQLAGAAPIAFSADGRMLLTGSGGEQNRIEQWDLAPLENLRHNASGVACMRAGMSLDRDTWTFFAPSIEFSDVCTGK